MVDVSGNVLFENLVGDSTISVSSLVDTVITTPTDNQALSYDTATGKWINQTIAGGGGGGVTDHGALTGLSDDDHSQYITASPTTAARNKILPANQTSTNITLKGATSQTARLLKLESGTGAEIGYFAADGSLSSLSVASPNIDAQTNMTTPAIQGGAGTFDSVAVTGNVTVTGTVDGRDVATDGTNQDTHIGDSNIHFTEGSIDHTAITNIGTKSHAQIDTHIGDSNIHFTEGSIDHIAITNIGTNSHAEIDTHIADGTKHFTVGSIDHGSLDAASLGDDDHTQYTLANGTRAMTKLDVTGTDGIVVNNGDINVTGSVSATVDVSSAVIKGATGQFGDITATGTLDVTGDANLKAVSATTMYCADDGTILGSLTVKNDIIINGVVDGVDIAALSTNFTNHHTDVTLPHDPFTTTKDGFVPNPAGTSTDHHFVTAAGSWKARPNEYLELTTSADTPNGGTAVATTIDNWETTTYIKDSATTWVFDDTDITLPFTGIYEITLKLYFQKDSNGVHEHMIWIEEDSTTSWVPIEKSYAAGLNRAGSAINPSESSSTSTFLWSGTAGDMIRARFEVNNFALDYADAERSTILIKRIDL